MIFRRLIKKILKNSTKEPIIPITVQFQGLAGKTVVSTSQKSILQIAQDHDIDIPHYCGGSCRCGTCSVLILEGQNNLSTPTGNEEMVLGVDKFQKGHRLACQANVHGDVSLNIPEWF
jgi:ferredoxin